MESVLWYVVPLGIAMALSILPILAVVLLLLSPNPVPVSVGYAAGWALGVLTLATVFTIGARLIPPDVSASVPTWVHAVEIALGAVLMGWAVISAVRSRRRPSGSSAPSWTGVLESLGPRRAFAFGLAMNVRPKNLTLAVAAGLAIGAASLDVPGSALAVVIFTILGVSTVAGLVLAFLFGSRRVRPALEGLSEWLVSHAQVVLWISTFLVGAILVAIGVGHLVSPTPAPEDDEPAATAEQWDFVSRPDLTPPVISVTHTGGDASVFAPDTYAFLGPKDLDDGSAMQGAEIVDAAGDPVWVLNTGEDSAFDVRVQDYLGQDVLTYWVGESGFHGQGEVIVLDDTYTELTRVTTSGSIGPGQADMHETTITPAGTMLLIAYITEPADLTAVGGPEDGYVLAGHVQEVDIATGEAIFEWSSLDEVPVTESQYELPEDGGTIDKPYDYIHLNAVSLDGDDGFLVSARNTWTVYRLDRASATIDWRLGGSASDIEIAEDAQFAWQHDAHRRDDGTITLFDNESPSLAAVSRGLRLSVDEDAGTASLVTEYLPSGERVSTTQGNVQQLPNGNVVVGWGSQPYYSEFSADGDLLYDATFTAGTSYRAYVFPWSATPAESPTAVLSDASSDPEDPAPTVYVSWNGATEVASWRILSGDSDTTASVVTAHRRTGFETALPLPAGTVLGAYTAVQALDAYGDVLGTTTLTTN
ncbi:hypothetical protein GCM10009808_10900 [Microbacterium sediminicola]|uniref:Arylsulfotransferase (ASST) n=1 Tax=Microbacterium sediminicola TaxID=415210 RepID=A0ABP4TXQ4_9MICO